ncbi:hypothetical protein V1509DRAFT_636036 [Lipomyces kononenkoae]
MRLAFLPNTQFVAYKRIESSSICSSSPQATCSIKAAMKFLALATFATFATSVLAATESIYLKVKSDNSTIDGQGLSSIHEGAAINYVFLGGASELLAYESTNNTIYDPYIFPPYPFYLQLWGSILIIGVGVVDDVEQFRIDSNNYLTVNGSENVFYATMNTNDPYNYSAYSYQALYFADKSEAPEGAIPFRIFVESADSTTSSVATTTSAEPSIATAVYTNATTTTSKNSTATSTNSTTTSTAPAHFTGAATVNKVSGALALGAAVFAMLL